MTRRGRPPKPIPLKVLDGGMSKAKAERLGPKAPPQKPHCPSWLSQYAKTEWKRVVNELDRRGMVAAVDRSTLAVYCQAVATFKEATEAVQKGILVRGQKGEAVKNPALQVQRDAARMIATYSSMFGFSPSDRVRILQEGVTDDGNTLEDLLSAR